MTIESLKPGARVGVSGEFRPDINGLRALAVVAVVLYHFGMPGFSGGFLGVDVFFVISGFLMTKIIVSKLEKNQFAIADFWLSRARRIFPALAVLCAVLLAAGWFSIDPSAYGTLATHAASSLVFVSNFVLWQEAGYFDNASREKWLLHTWSLSVEWQFYILFPVALLLIWRLFGTRRALITGLVIALLVSLVISVVATPLRPMAAYFLLPTRGWEMMAGGLVYIASLYYSPSRGVALALEFFGLLLIAAGTVGIDSADPWPGSLALIPVIGTSMVILARRTSSPITCNRVAGFIGDTSYSIYLWHWPVVVALYMRGVTAHAEWIAVGILLSVALGYVSFRLVETPLRKPLESRRSGVEWKFYGTVAGALMGVSLLIHRADGLPSRLSVGEIAYRDVVAAVGDWGHPGSNCEQLLYVTQCFNHGKNERLLMFIGDSLAEQWYPRYGSIDPGRSYSTLFLTKGACLPIRGIDTTAVGSNCAEFAESAWAAVFERRPQTVVIASIWLTYFFNADGNRRTGTCIRGDAGCTRIDNDALIADALHRLIPDIQRAGAMGIKVYLLAPTPQSGLDYPRARLAELASQGLPASIRRAPSEGITAPAFAVDRERYSRGLIVDLLQDTAKRSGATFVDPELYMCPNGRCSNVDSHGRPLYMDRGHLRQSYVQSDGVAWLDRIIGLSS